MLHWPDHRHPQLSIRAKVSDDTIDQYPFDTMPQMVSAAHAHGEMAESAVNATYNRAPDQETLDAQAAITFFHAFQAMDWAHYLRPLATDNASTKMLDTSDAQANRAIIRAFHLSQERFIDVQHVRTNLAAQIRFHVNSEAIQNLHDQLDQTNEAQEPILPRILVRLLTYLVSEELDHHPDVLADRRCRQSVAQNYAKIREAIRERNHLLRYRVSQSMEQRQSQTAAMLAQPVSEDEPNIVVHQPDDDDPSADFLIAHIFRGFKHIQTTTDLYPAGFPPHRADAHATRIRAIIDQMPTDETHLAEYRRVCEKLQDRITHRTHDTRS